MWMMWCHMTSQRDVMWRHSVTHDTTWWHLGKNNDKEGTLREGASTLRRFHQGCDSMRSQSGNFSEVSINQVRKCFCACRYHNIFKTGDLWHFWMDHRLGYLFFGAWHSYYCAWGQGSLLIRNSRANFASGQSHPCIFSCLRAAQLPT